MKCGREITQAPARVLDRPGEPQLFQPKGYGIKDCCSHWQTWLRRAETTTSGTGVEGRQVDGTEIGRHGLIPFRESGMD